MGSRRVLVTVFTTIIVTIFLAASITILGHAKALNRDPPDIGHVIATIQLEQGSAPVEIAYNPSNGYLYVASHNCSIYPNIDAAMLGENVICNEIFVINPKNNTVVATIDLGSLSEQPAGPWGMVYDPKNGYMYVTASFYSSVVIIINSTTNTIVGTIPVGLDPAGIVYDPSNGFLYVANWGAATISVINGTSNTVVATIDLGSPPIPNSNIPSGLLYGPVGMAYDPNNGYIYVTTNIVWSSSSPFGNVVFVIDSKTNRVVGKINVGPGPAGIVYDPDNGYIYVAITGLDIGNLPLYFSAGPGDTVSVINPRTNTVVDTITVGKGPFWIAYDPKNGYLYVTDTGSNEVTVIDGRTNTVIGTIPVGSEPAGIVYDPDNGYLYVVNYGSDSISVIATTAMPNTTAAQAAPITTTSTNTATVTSTAATSTTPVTVTVPVTVNVTATVAAATPMTVTTTVVSTVTVTKPAASTSLVEGIVIVMLIIAVIMLARRR